MEPAFGVGGHVRSTVQLDRRMFSVLVPIAHGLVPPWLPQPSNENDGNNKAFRELKKIHVDIGIDWNTQLLVD